MSELPPPTPPLPGERFAAFPNALKRQLAQELKTLLGAYSPGVTAYVLGIDQPRMSDILNGKLTRFSLQKLVRLLARLDRRVAITIVVEGIGRIRIFDFKPR